MPRCEAFLRPRKVQESDARTRACGCRHLGCERGDRLSPRIEVSQQLYAPEGREAISSQLFGALATTTAGEPALQFVTDRALDHFGVDPAPAGRYEAMDAEAQTKQVSPYGPRFLKVALVVIAVREAVKVKGLRQDGRDLIACDVRCEGARVRPYLRVGGT